MKKIFDAIFKFSIGLIVQGIINNLSGMGASVYILLFFNNIIISLLCVFIIKTISCYFMIWLYDRVKIDWFLIESFKKAKSEGEVFNQESVLIKVIKKAKPLLIIWDPAIAILIYRDKYYKWDRIPNTKMFFLFLISSIICTLLWTLIIAIPLLSLNFIHK
jgi:hypothetical protein